MAIHHPKVIPALVAALRDKYIYREVVETLGQMRAVATQPEVVAALVAALDDLKAAQSKVESALLDALHSLDEDVRRKAAAALRQMRAAATQPKVVSALIAALRFPAEDVRRSAVEALEQRGTAATQPKVVSALIAALDDPEEDVRRRAAVALGVIMQEVRIFRRWWGKMEVRRVDKLANQ